MDAQNIELTEDAVKELLYDLEGNEKTSESVKEVIREAKQQLFSNLKSVTEKKIKKLGHTNTKNWVTTAKDFQFKEVKVSYLFRNNLWLDLAIVEIPENNIKFLVVDLPFHTAELFPIKNSTFTLSKINFDEIFRILGDNKFITEALKKHLLKFIEPKPIADSSSKKARDLFGGLMD